MNTRTLITCAALAIVSGGGGGCQSPEPVGSVTVALAAEACAAHCASGVRAEIFRVGEDLFPLGPAAQGDCGDSLAFDGLPAGTAVYVTVDLYDDAGQKVLAGSSAPVTVVADGSAAATVVASALAGPVIHGLSPDPALAVDAPALVTIDGENLGGGLGDSGALLGALNVSIVREVKDGALRTEVVVPVGAAGGALVYRECGAASEPRPLRVIGPSLGAAPVSLPSACAVAALAPEPDEAAVLVAFACDDQAKSYVQRFRAGPAATVCPLDGDEIWHLAQRPTALAPGWVGLDGGGVARFDPTVAGDAGPPEGSGRVSVMALAETGVYGLIDGRVAKVDAAQRVVGGIDAGLALVDLVAVPGGLAALAGSGGVAGEGRIVSISGADDRVDTLSLPECHGPRALAGDAARFVVACDDGLVVYARADKTVKVLSDVRAARVALDPRGDVVFAWDPGVGASAIDLGAGSVLHAWAQTDDPPTPLLLALDLDPAQATLGLLATTGAGDALTLWTPYDAEGLCR